MLALELFDFRQRGLVLLVMHALIDSDLAEHGCDLQVTRCLGLIGEFDVHLGVFVVLTGHRIFEVAGVGTAKPQRFGFTIKPFGEGMSFYGFRVNEADDSWRRCVAALETRHVGDDL